ncbi:MAG: hypothetical protein M0Q27_01185, partial [Candidatus Colwellbacteria bacterium]|nr:hypothetical protein [Candidatus Colwellbacteria bacterium]
VLAAAVVIVLNPAELLAEARDSQRITDMKTLKDSVDIWVVDNPNVSMGISQTVYISIPDTSSTCANISDLPALPSGWAYTTVQQKQTSRIRMAQAGYLLTSHPYTEEAPYLISL